MAGVPNLRGMTVAQAQQALQGSGYNISNISAGGQTVSAGAAGSDPIYSYTTYPDGTVRIGLLNAVSGGSSSSTGTGSGTGTSSGTGGSTGTGTSGTSTTAPTPAGSPTGSTTSQIPGWSTGTGYDTSAALAGSSNGTVTPGGGVQQYQQTQGQSMGMLSTFFGTGGGYAPQYLPPYGAGSSGQVYQVEQGSASGTQATSPRKSKRGQNQAKNSGMIAASGSVT